MGADAANVALLLKAAGVGVPVAVVVLTFLITSIIFKYIGGKQDKDRNEHIEKWNSMIETLKASSVQQGQTMQLIIDTNRTEMDRIMSTHREEFDRLYKLYERQAASIDVICHNISAMSRILETKHFCPNQMKG